MVKYVSKRRGREFWERVVATVEVEGASHAEAAARYGVSIGALRSWIYRIRREAAANHSSRTSVRVLPVRVAGSACGDTIEVRVGDVVVSVPEGAEPGYVAALVAALRSVAC